MRSFDRREFLAHGLAGSSLLLFSPLLPGCPKPAATADPLTSQGGAGPLPAEWGELFGVSQETAARVLARAMERGGDFADLFFEHRLSDSLKLEEGMVNEAYASVARGAGVRVVVGDQTGYAYTEFLSEEALLEAAGTAALIAASKAQGAVPSFEALEVPSRYPVQGSPTDYPVADKLALLRRIDAAARTESSDLHVVVAFQRSEQKRLLLFRSDGRVCWDSRPKINLGAFVSAIRGERTERNSYSEGGALEQSFYGGDKPEQIAREAVRRTLLSFDAVTPPAGEMPVVLGSGHSGILLHEAVGHGLEGDINRKKVSIYADRIGEEVASQLCTIIDDGTLANSQGSICFDDEGVESQRNVLIENGVLRGYMHDRISAAHFGVAPTGNGRRQSYKHQPLPRMTNTFMPAGSHSKDEVFEGIERGIYAIDFTNGQVNIGAGDYTFFVNYGYLIEKGQVTAPIKDVNIIGNGPESLMRVDRVAGDLVIPDSGSGACGKGGQRVSVNFGLPHVRISKVTVGGREG